MTAARSQLVDVNATRYYHCISRCVRKVLLCGEGFGHRKQWIEDRLQTLAGCFAVSVCGFAIMDNHLHVLVQLEPDRALAPMSTGIPWRLGCLLRRRRARTRRCISEWNLPRLRENSTSCATSQAVTSEDQLKRFPVEQLQELAEQLKSAVLAR